MEFNGVSWLWHPSSVSGMSLGDVSEEVAGRLLGGLWEVFQLNFLALESLKRVWEVSGGSLEVPWRSLRGLWEVSGRFLGGFWGVSGRFLRGLWEVS